MDFKWSDELESMRKMAYDFAVKNIKPTMEEDEKEHKYRPELLKKMGDQGMFACLAPEQYGGLGSRRRQHGSHPDGNRSCEGQPVLGSSLQPSDERSAERAPEVRKRGAERSSSSRA